MKPRTIDRIDHDHSKNKAKSFIIEFKYGPDRKGPKQCLSCKKPFVAGDTWQLHWDPEHVYAIGLHSQCIAARKNRKRDAH